MSGHALMSEPESLGPCWTYMQGNDAWVLCKQCLRGVAILLAVASAAPMLQMFAGDGLSWIFLPVVMAGVVARGRKPGRTMQRVFHAGSTPVPAGDGRHRGREIRDSGRLV